MFVKSRLSTIRVSVRIAVAVVVLVASAILASASTNTAAAYDLDRFAILSATEDCDGEGSSLLASIEREGNLSYPQPAEIPRLSGPGAAEPMEVPVSSAESDCIEESRETYQEGEEGICDVICKSVFGRTFPRPGGGTCYYRRCNWSWTGGASITCWYLCSTGGASE